jgi:cob(I)alamin adenosyltransferase
MKIYTKKGDKGETSLIGGARVPKNHIRVEAYGAVDELIAAIGIVRAHEQVARYRDLLLEIQNVLMNAAALLAADETATVKLPEITDSNIANLEHAIDEISAQLPPLRSFIIPGEHPTESFVHLARSICRRAERVIVSLNAQSHPVPEALLQYINRLSDFLFAFAREIDNSLNLNDIAWKQKI